MKRSNTSQVDRIIQYEQGDLDDEGTIDLFQELLDSGLVWALQGHYGRTAQVLMNAGLIKLATKADSDEYTHSVLHSVRR